MSDIQPQEHFETTLRSSRSSRIVWLVLGLIILGVGGIALWRWKQSTESQAVAPPAESKPLPAPAAAPVPTLSMTEGDSLARQLGTELSKASELAKWLAEPDILRRLVAAVNLIAEGNSPRPVLSFLIPSGQFEVVRAGRAVRASPKSYARYDAVTRVLASVDPSAAGKAFGQLKPYIDSAFAQIGRPGQPFDGVLRQAIGNLTSAPIPDGQPLLEEKGAVYAYRDPKLEQLSAAQKLLLRMGPENARAIQAWLTKLEAAIPRPSP